MKKPNILMLMSDQHPVFMLGCYGDGIVRTPTLNGIADRGAVFDAAYCPSPLCAPSRAAMMTSRHISAIEVWDNASPLRSDWPTFAHSFRRAGYRTILCGKMHFVGPDQLHGFEERWTQDIYPATFKWTISNRERLAVKAKNTGQSKHRVMESGIGWSPDMDYDEEVLFRALYGLRQIARSNEDYPFFLCVSFAGPHYPYVAPKNYWQLYSREDIPIPQIPDDYQSSDHTLDRWLRIHEQLEDRVPDKVCRTARHATMSRITMIDDYCGHILKLLGETGLEGNTITLYTSDHGDMMGERGLWFKMAPYEWSSRVPLMISGPGIPQRRFNIPVSLLDLGPTLCGLAGVESAYGRGDGRDLADAITGRKKIEAENSQAIVEYYGDGTWKGWRMLRRGRFKLIVLPGEVPLLYDLDTDPEEKNNLAAEAAYESIVSEMTERIMDGWDPVDCDERRWQSEERRLAIERSIEGTKPLDWDMPSPSLPHPYRTRGKQLESTTLDISR
jgi:choline-sulfatase